jgi:VanZ family protein
MTASAAEPRGWFTRGGYAGLAAAFALFIVYGSLVPLVFRSVSFAEALREFTNALSEPLVIDSRTDFVTNILLTIPLAYLTLAALMTDRRGLVRHLLAALVTMACCFSLSVAVEFAQVFTQSRTDSLSDIVAQSIGTVIGTVFWLAAGQGVTRWLRESLKEREQPAMIQRILLAYCIVFAIAQVMPLDLTLSLSQLAAKYRRGMILLRPFSYHHLTTFDMWWDYLGDVVLNIPVGAAMVLLWTRERTRRAPLAAFALGVVFVGLVECAQVFVGSRFADSTDVITGSLGILAGILLAGAQTRHRAVLRLERPQAGPHAMLGRIGVAGWMVALMAYHWNPFDFTTTPVRVTEGVHQILSVPFYSYYLGTEYHALTEMLRKFLLAAPLGLFLGLSWPPPNRSRFRVGGRFVVAALLAFCLLVGIEVGQIFLPTRTPDITDALVGEAGVVLAMWLTGRILDMGVEQQQGTDEVEAVPPENLRI